jgi:hypothetical protein
MTRTKKPSSRHNSLTFTGDFCPSTGKVSYVSEWVAKMALARLRSQRSNLIAVYQCPHPQCQQWHLTSQEQR